MGACWLPKARQCRSWVTRCVCLVMKSATMSGVGVNVVASPNSTCWRQKWMRMSMCREAGLLAGCSAMVMAPLLSQNSMVGSDWAADLDNRKSTSAYLSSWMAHPAAGKSSSALLCVSAPSRPNTTPSLKVELPVFYRSTSYIFIQEIKRLIRRSSYNTAPTYC